MNEVVDTAESYLDELGVKYGSLVKCELDVQVQNKRWVVEFEMSNLDGARIGNDHILVLVSKDLKNVELFPTM